jgi:thiol-disulfide isomerase/thioredoxin
MKHLNLLEVQELFKVKFFFKKDCPKCPAAKAVVSQLPEELVEYHNLDEVDGLTEGAYYMVVSTPTVLVVDDQGREVRAWRGEVPELTTLREVLSL